MALLRPCSHPGCPTLVRRGRCHDHRMFPVSLAISTTVLRFDHVHKPFYNSRAWKQARDSYLRTHPICETCRRASSTEVHHRVSLQDIAEHRIPEWVLRLGIDPELVDLRLDDRNFLAQCKPCHSKETVRQDGGFGRSPRSYPPQQEPSMPELLSPAAVTHPLLPEVPYADGRIPLSRWGEDHWSTLAYVETVCVDRGGWIDGDRMRVHARRHRKLAGPRQLLLGGRILGQDYPTILRDGSLPRHDDWDCLLDLEAEGLIQLTEVEDNGDLFGGTRVRAAMTEAGNRTAARLRAHKAGGSTFATFMPETGCGSGKDRAK